MRLSGRIAAAIDLLTIYDAGTKPAADCLRSWAQANRFAGSGDRAAIGNLVFDVLRRRASHAYLMGDNSPRAVVLSTLVRDWGLPVDELNIQFETDKFSPEEISDQERANLEKDADLANAPLEVQANIPAWIIPSFERAFGENWLAQANAFTDRAPLDLRVNTLKVAPYKVIRGYTEFNANATEIVPEAVRIEGATREAKSPNMQAESRYEKGYFEIQDEGSQIVSALCDARSNEQVLDLCAGAGGKTLALAVHMNNKGQIFAYDKNPDRLEPINDRIVRSDLHNIQVLHPEITDMEALEGTFDRVIVDAPCSGVGTWRRHPDTKWNLTAETVSARNEEQDEVLDDAVRMVKNGGHIAYITCSVLPEENDDRIDAFLVRHPGFTLVNAVELYAQKFPDAKLQPLSTNGKTLVLSPLSTKTDGFFFALLKKSA